MKISETPTKSLTESYSVKIWVLPKDDVYWKQEERIVYANSKGAHKQIERYCIQKWTGDYDKMNIVSIVYQ